VEVQSLLRMCGEAPSAKRETAGPANARRP
jgi:hypothetical protein